MKTLTFKIGKTGEITSEADGFKGGKCLETTEKYLLALGRTFKTELKPEFYETEEVHLTEYN
jgi:hypothetical protein